MSGLSIFRSLLSLIVPATLNTTVRDPSFSNAARRLPEPLSLRFVTAITSPPRPPDVNIPAPHAPGKAGITPSGNLGGWGGIIPDSGFPATCCAYISGLKKTSKNKLIRAIWYFSIFMFYIKFLISLILNVDWNMAPTRVPLRAPQQGLELKKAQSHLI